MLAGQAHAQVFVTDDAGVTEFTAPSTAGTSFYSDSNPVGDLASYGGSLFVDEYTTGNILELSSTGSATLFGSGYGHIESLGFDTSGDLFISSKGGSEIDEIMSNGTHRVFATGVAADGDMAFDSSGNLYVTSVGNGTVEKITSTGTVSLFASSLNEPDGIAFDKGSLYIANFGSNSIEQFSLAGVGSNFLSNSPATAGPLGLAVDSAGNLWATENSNLGIYEIGVNAAGAETSVTRYTGDANDPEKIVVETAAPEPATLGMLLGGVGLLALRQLRARRW